MGEPTVEAWQRAIPRDLLTGEPLRDDTPKMRVTVLNPATGQRNEPIRYGPRGRVASGNPHPWQAWAASRSIGEELEPLAYVSESGGDDDAE